MPKIRRLVSVAALGLSALAVLGIAPSAFAQEGDSCDIIKTVEVRGNQKMSADAVRFDLALKPGARWDDTVVRREFARFWRRGFFADLRFLRRCEADGAVLVIEMKERPTLLSVTYDKSGKVTQQQIDDYYKQRDFSLPIGTPLDRKKIWRAEGLIRDVLAQKGYADAQVTGVIKETSPSTRSVHFRIRPGGKTRIRKLDFVGNQAFKDRVLRGQLKLVQPWHWYWPWSSKSLYHPLKYQQDAANVVQFYKDQGYLDADLRPPIVEIRPIDPEKAARKAEKRSARQARKEERARAKAGRTSGADVIGDSLTLEKPQPDLRIKKWVYLTVPVEEGEIYHLADVKFEGNTIFKAEELRPFIPIAAGGVISDAALEAGLKMIRTLYGARGYVYAAVTRRFERKPDSEKPVADVVVEIEEDQAYTVRRIEFRGNTTTNDRVLRRELNVNEGDLLNKAQLDRSMQKLQMLRYWVPGEEPTLEPVRDRAEVDVRIQGEEQSRNEVQVGGGYSELEGAFFLASYQTLNFAGRGEALDLSVAVGGRANRASIGFSEPWFLGKPYTFGFQLYRRSLDYGVGQTVGGTRERLGETSTGASVTLGKRLGDFALLQFSYGFQSVDASAPDQRYQFSDVETRIATLSPYFSYRRLNNALRPTRGFTLEVIPQIGGKFLGGNSNFFRPRISTSFYRPFWDGKFFIGSHLEAAYIIPFGDTVRERGYVDGVPIFQRFYLGGDTIGPRVFESRSISPLRVVTSLNPDGTPVLDMGGNPVIGLSSIGGNKMVLGQFELGYPIGKTATLAGFFDAGGVYDEGNKINTRDLRIAAGLEFRIFLPVFQAPIRLIYGWPLREKEGDVTSRFQFSIGLPF